MAKSLLIAILSLLVLAPTGWADVRVANIFGDNMVLQRDEPLNFFGTADPGENVTVTFKGQSVVTKAGVNGRWLAQLPSIQVGDPFTVTIQGADNRVELKNVVAGEVWICSGQSNMEWAVSQSAHPQKEIAAANWPLIRHVKIQHQTSATPQSEAANSGWQVCSPETVGNFTAVGYYFGRHLHQELDVPIGLINTSWGGTIVETWISSDSLQTHEDFRERVAEIRKNSADLAERMQNYTAAMERWNKAYRAAMDSTNKEESWKAGLDDSGWRTHNVPMHWEQQGLDGFDGVVWYRRDVEIPEDWNQMAATLSLGGIDDNDETFVNGKRIGGTSAWNVARNYEVPAELVKSGTMSIAVKVTDNAGAGGFHGKPEALKIQVAGKPALPLAGKWKYKVGEGFGTLPPRPRNPSMSGPNHPTLLHNAMVNPIIPITFRGAIWYQGESNAGRAYQYREMFPLLIEDWRAKWNREFPFYWVQLANFMATRDEPSTSAWAELREAQSMTRKLPRTGEAVIIDIGDARDIHPKNKQDVGKRLALHALANEYQQEIVHSGPRFQRATIEGNKIRITFSHVGSGLVAKGGGKLTQFAIAGEDQKFVWADARIDYNEVVVSSRDVAHPVAVRYAWADNPEGCNLFNKDGLPASPFRTDSWKGVTADNR